MMPEFNANVYAVLLAGGSGTRLWPVSRELFPKQLVQFIGDDSLIQSTVKRLTAVLGKEKIRIVCGQEHTYETARQIQAIGVHSGGKIISEPCGRNTAPAILLAILLIQQQEKDAVVCVFPADHVIRNIEKFHEKLKSAIRLAQMGYIVTFGITPFYPETGYGYIEGGEELPEQARVIQRFVEKPDMKTAQYYLESGNFFWNSGMFTFKTSVMMDELKIHHPELLDKMKQFNLSQDDLSREAYEQLPNISIDYAVMEKTQKGAVLPSDFDWSDIGSWKSLYDFMSKDADGNVIEGDVMTTDTENCLILGSERLVATNHLKNTVVVETPDAVFVSEMESSRDVKSIVTQLKEKGRLEYKQHKAVHYSWGTVKELERKDDFTVTQRIVYPGEQLKIKSDYVTEIHLFVVKGSGRAKNNNQSRLLKKGAFLNISGSQTAVLENHGKELLYIVEIKLKKKRLHI